MRLRTIAAIGFVALLVTTGVAAAMPGNAPADAGSNEPGDADDAGPPSALPEPVPDFVSQIHDAIRSFLSGDLTGSLGEAVSGIASEDNPAPADGG